MKYTAAIVSAFAAAAAADAVFDVTNFSAACIPHSSQCRYSFDVVLHGAGETTPVNCLYMGTSDGTLPAVSDAPCTDSSRTFSVAKGSDGLTLTVSQPVTPSSNQSGSHLLANSDLQTATQPNAQVQSYTGTNSFSLE